KAVVISQSPLSDRDRVILQPDLAVIVEHGNSRAVVVPSIVSLLQKWHVIFAKFSGRCIGIYFRTVVPKSELALARNEICAGNASIVIPPAHGWIKLHKLVSRSAPFTATVLNARIPLVFFPSGRKMLPY